MQNSFIELTDDNGNKFLLNVNSITIIKPYGDKSMVGFISDIGTEKEEQHGIKVKESYAQIKALLGS